MSEVNVTAALRDAIAQERRRRNLTSDEALARELHIAPKHLSRWRNGKTTKLDTLLAELLVRMYTTPETIA